MQDARDLNKLLRLSDVEWPHSDFYSTLDEFMKSRLETRPETEERLVNAILERHPELLEVDIWEIRDMARYRASPTRLEILALQNMFRKDHRENKLLNDLVFDTQNHHQRDWHEKERGDALRTIVQKNPELGRMTIGEIQKMPLPPAVPMATA